MVTIDVSCARDGVSEVTAGYCAIELMEENPGRSGVDVSGAGGIEPTRVGISGAHDEVGESITIDVSGARDGPAEQVAPSATIEPMERVPLPADKLRPERDLGEKERSGNSEQ